MVTPDEHHSMVHCTECCAPLAHDQRYCLECGNRRGPLPSYISQLIGRIMEQGRRLIPSIPLVAEQPVKDARGLDAWLGAPRAAAVAVIGMLGFGVVVGSLVSGAGASALQPLLVAVSASNTHASGSGGGGGGGDARASSGGSTRTIAVGSTSPTTTPAGAGASGSGSGSPSSGGGASTPSTNTNLPPIKHVFLIALSDQGYNETLGHSSFDPYLAKTLARKGELIGNYYAVAGGSLANEIALVSGQGPTPQTLADCPVFKNVVPGVADTSGQVLGTGCAYPTDTQTIADQLTAAHKTWKAYLQTTGTSAHSWAELCRPRLGSSSGSSPQPDATWHNPFLYFRSLTGKTGCPKENVDLGRLVTDLKSESTTPALSYIVPDLCHNGGATPCRANAQSGMVAADAFLKSVVPQIEKSAAYKSSGMIAITFDQAPQTGPYADPSSCCHNPTYPNLPSPSNSGGSTGAPCSGTQTGSTTPTSSTGTTTTTGSTTPTSSTGTTTTPCPTTPTSTTVTTTTTAPTTPVSTTGTTTTGSTTTPVSTTGTTTTGSTTTPTSTTGTTTTGSTTPGLGSGQTKPTGGGGQVGLLLLSRYVKPGTLEVFDYFNHFSLLASIEDLFGLKRLGYASQRLLPVFGAAVYTAYSG